MVGRVILVHEVGVRLPVPQPYYLLTVTMDKKNPFLSGFCAPASDYGDGINHTITFAAATVAITNDFLMAIMFMLFTLGILGAYVTEFPIFPTLCQNEILHKAAISALLGMGLGMMMGLAIAGWSRKRGNCPNFNTGQVHADLGSDVTSSLSIGWFFLYPR